MSGKQTKRGRTGPSAGSLRRAAARDRRDASERAAHQDWLRVQQRRLALGPEFIPGARLCHSAAVSGVQCAHHLWPRCAFSAVTILWVQGAPDPRGLPPHKAHVTQSNRVSVGNHGFRSRLSLAVLATLALQPEQERKP